MHKYEITITGFEPIQVESYAVELAIQSLYPTPLKIELGTEQSFNTKVRELTTDNICYYIISEDCLNGFAEELLTDEKTVAVFEDKETSNYFYGNFYSFIHTDRKLEIDAMVDKSIVAIPRKALGSTTDFTELEQHDIPFTFVDRYTNLTDCYENISVRFEVRTPLYNARNIAMAQKFLGCTKIYIPKNPSVSTHCVMFFKDDTTSPYYYILLPVENKDMHKVGFVCTTTKVYEESF